MNRAATTALLGLGLALRTAAPAAAFWEWCSQDTPRASAHERWLYQTNRGVPGLPWAQPWPSDYPTPSIAQGGTQFWQYHGMPFGPTTAWVSTMATAGLYVEQHQSPAGYLIRIHTGQRGAPAVDIDVQGGFLTIRTGAAEGAAGGTGMPVQQVAWATRWIALPTDANVAAMQMQWGDGVAEIFIPRGR